MYINKTIRKQLLEKAMRKTGIPADSSCWVVTDLIPADCKLQDFWPLIEGWLEENCNNEPYSTYTEFGYGIYQDACTLYRALLGEYATLMGILDAVEEDVWEDIYEAQNQDARCILVKYFVLPEKEADVLGSQGFVPSSSYIPCTKYGKHVEECIRTMTKVRMRA